MNDTRRKHPSPATRERLLDVAEELFAEKGYHAVSMRDIARRAKVNLAATGYHFGSKENLFIESLTRQLRPLNERRLVMLTEMEARKCKPTLAQVLDVFARVMVEKVLQDPKAGKRLYRALSRAFAESDEIARAVFRREMLPAAMRFLAAIRRSCPGLSPEGAGMGLALYAGSLIHMLRWAVEPISPELRGATKFEVESAMQVLVGFGTAGFQRLAAAERKKAGRKKP